MNTSNCWALRAGDRNEGCDVSHDRCSARTSQASIPFCLSLERRPNSAFLEQFHAKSTACRCGTASHTAPSEALGRVCGHGRTPLRQLPLHAPEAGALPLSAGTAITATANNLGCSIGLATAARLLLAHRSCRWLLISDLS